MYFADPVQHPWETCSGTDTSGWGKTAWVLFWSSPVPGRADHLIARSNWMAKRSMAAQAGAQAVQRGRPVRRRQRIASDQIAQAKRLLDSVRSARPSSTDSRPRRWADAVVSHHRGPLAVVLSPCGVGAAAGSPSGTGPGPVLNPRTLRTGLAALRPGRRHRAGRDPGPCRHGLRRAGRVAAGHRSLHDDRLPGRLRDLRPSGSWSSGPDSSVSPLILVASPRWSSSETRQRHRVGGDAGGAGRPDRDRPGESPSSASWPICSRARSGSAT